MNFLVISLLIHCYSFYIQAQSAHLPHLGGVDVHFSGMIDCFTQVVKNKGILSLWNGLTANTIKVQFLLYVQKKLYLRRSIHMKRVLVHFILCYIQGTEITAHD